MKLYLPAFFLLFLLASPVFADLEISEIMANPIGSAKAEKPAGEWVELYNSGNETINLTDYQIKDSKDENELHIVREKLIIEDPVLLLEANSYLVVYRDGDTDFNLNDQEDKVRLFDSNGTLLDEFSYFETSEGKSWGKVDGEWRETSPTPGAENKFIDICDWKISIQLENTTFLNSSAEFVVIAERLEGIPREISIKGRVEDLFGKTIKEYSPWTDKKVTSDVRKTYSPRLAEGTYQLKFWFDNLQCEDSNLENNEFISLIAINPLRDKEGSSVSIEEIYIGNDKKAAWGDQIRVKINVYKGDETKKTGELWVEMAGEKVSKVAKITMEDKYKSYPLTMPLQLEANCNNKIKDGTAKVFLKAFDLTTEESFEISEVNKQICKDYMKYVREQEKIEKKELKAKEEAESEEETVAASNSVTGAASLGEKDSSEPEGQTTAQRDKEDYQGIVIYESNSQKARNLIPYILAVTFGLLCVVLVWKKEG